MFEIILLFLVMFVVAACAFLPLGYSMLHFSKSAANKSESASASKLIIPEDSTLRRHFLTHLKSEIESALHPRPTDSVLQRHYDAMVAAELENRLAALAE